MEGTIVLVLVLTFLVGGLMLALVMGYSSIEESRAVEAARPASELRPTEVVMVPSFFAPVENLRLPMAAGPFDEALLARVEQHVKAERATVAHFVHYPSIDSLYRQSGSSLHVH